MAMRWCVVRRAASMATRSARAPPAAAPSYSCILPFSTSSADASQNSDQSPNSKPTEQVDGLPFDSIKVDHSQGTMTLRRKTKDEILDILVEEDYDHIEKCECVSMCVKFVYGDEFNKCMEFDILSLPDNQIFIRKVKMSGNGDESEKVHLDEMEGFLEKRGINMVI